MQHQVYFESELERVKTRNCFRDLLNHEGYDTIEKLLNSSTERGMLLLNIWNCISGTPIKEAP